MIRVDEDTGYRVEVSGHRTAALANGNHVPTIRTQTQPQTQPNNSLTSPHLTSPHLLLKEKNRDTYIISYLP